MSQKNLYKALGPLAPLFEDPEITEIMVDGPERVTIEKHGGKIEDANVHFNSNDEVKAAIAAVLDSMGIEMEDDKTIYEARLGDHSRMMAILSPTAINGHSVIFRKFMKNQITWEQLVKYNSVSIEMRALIQSALDAHVNILIAGGTASGKTTLANRIIELLPPSKRVVAVEQAHEFQFSLPRAVFLEVTDNLRMPDLLTAASKMRPDWLAVGELLGGEAIRAMQIFGNGHSGIATIHADNLENALTRLESMCLMANLGLGLDEIRTTIASALRLVLYQECLEPNRKRKLTKISELCGLENGRYVLKPLMRYNPETDAFEATGAKPTWEK